ncbi:phosphatidate cytidylyltransferase [Acetobacter sp. TBRC 12305]|uniref:Phosphatidate cytidylyltransferase n=1 Tax=Acetobacter garciniae TaxID=2817435 RepID=A0A939HJ34_9PROT|nr:phosphatidate cytidylyltransferase [Acetobacter garciniae]MBO1323670.1 phosphatidate cytidylyltransferase [Acetobacter garciniae]MBX0343359.1 phosphatidate cytidylyltransferase [Acetobacter garciniae]
MTPADTSAWRDLRPRLLSALVMVAVAAFCIGTGGVAYAVMVVAAMAGMAAEAARLFSLAVKSWRGALYVLWATCAGLSAATGHWRYFALFCVTSLVFGAPLCGIMCVIIAAGTALLWLREASLWPVVFVVAVVVASDSSAYLVGRLVGGPKLAPRISPGKTRSGAVGGLLGAMAAGAAVAALSGLGGVPGAVFWGGVLGLAAQLGDLAESALKRALGVKDSGTMLPGHGGLLDRFDGLVVAAPVAASVSLCAVAPAPFWMVGAGDIMGALAGLPG